MYKPMTLTEAEANEAIRISKIVAPEYTRYGIAWNGSTRTFDTQKRNATTGEMTTEKVPAMEFLYKIMIHKAALYLAGEHPKEAKLQNKIINEYLIQMAMAMPEADIIKGAIRYLGASIT